MFLFPYPSLPPIKCTRNEDSPPSDLKKKQLPKYKSEDGLYKEKRKRLVGWRNIYESAVETSSTTLTDKQIQIQTKDNKSNNS